jgi:hypothetical protein
MRREERRAQILEAAARAFRSGGFDGTSMDDVARAAGVTRLIVYRIFESKDDLYRAVIDADGFRLLWRHAAHEPQFAPLADLFRTFAVDHAESLLAEEIRDATMLHWAARAILGYLYDGICTWLDDGDAARDGEFVEMLGVGSRALVAALSGR